MKTFAAALAGGAIMLSSGFADNLIDNASFELPAIKGLTPTTKGGDPSSTEAKTTWTSLLVPKAGGEGTLTAGLTDTVARTGKQSLFVDFNQFKETGEHAMLSADMVPIKPDSPYRISFWGRLDRDRPLTMDERRPHIIVTVEYFAADQETQIGETEYRTQMIPGNIVPGLGVRLLFSSTKWAEYYAELKSPLEAAFMKMVVMVETARAPGVTDGVIYIDDAGIEGERGPQPAEVEETDEDDEKAASPAAPAAPAPKAQ